MSEIHDAAGAGDLARVTELLEQDSTLANADDQHGWRPIFHAGLRKQLTVVQALIDHGADLAAHDGYVMHYAGEVPDNKPVVELLVKYGGLDAHAEPKSELARQFICAVFLANETRVRAMLAADPGLVTERYAREDTALHHACRNGDTAIVAALLDHGADVNALAGGQFPLYCAAGHGHADTVALLLEHGANRTMRLGDGKNTAEWLKQYVEHDARFRRCLELIEQN